MVIFTLLCSFLPHSRCWLPSACSIPSQQNPASLDEAHRTPSSVYRLRLCSDPESLASFWVWQAQNPWKFLNYFSWYKQLRPPEYLCVSTKMLTVMVRRGNKLIFGPEHLKYIFLLTLIINIKLSYNVFPKSHKCKSENKNPINSETLKES